MRIDRMLAITVLLLNRDRISARALSEKFEVSVRTIYRDIDAINLAGIPVVSYPGNNGGFGIMDNYKLDRQVLTLKDMVAIVSALRGISTSLDYDELDGAIEKIRSLLPKQHSSDQTSPSEQFVVELLPWGYRRRQKDVIKTVHEAIIKNTLLRFLYRNSKGESRKRRVEPMTLFFRGFAWYLFAYCRLKRGFRFFRLSRMSGVKQATEIFERRETSFREYWPEEDSIPHNVDLVLRFSSKVRFRVEDYFDRDQIRLEKSGELIVTVSLPEDDWVYSMLLSYGEDAEVLEPARIREILAKKAKKILTLYNPDTQVS